MDWTSKAKKRIECRIRHMIVRFFASEWCMNSLFQKEKIYRNGSFSISSTVCPCTTKPPSSPFWSDNVGWKIWLGGCRFSGGEMTGKFRKVASHSAPEPAFGLFLNLPWGICPLEPRHANGDNSVLEISTGYFFSDCHGLAKTLSCIYQRGTLHIPLWNPLLI